MKREIAEKYMREVQLIVDAFNPVLRTIKDEMDDKDEQLHHSSKAIDIQWMISEELMKPIIREYPDLAPYWAKGKDHPD
jgi:hypothetical protein